MVVFNQAQFAELVHEKIDALPRSANHLRQNLLVDLGEHGLELPFFADAGEKQKRTSQSQFAIRWN